jgi:ABC-type branched-subunit amino acid transport system permease subunit
MDVVFYLTGSLADTSLLVFSLVRTVVLVGAGPYLGRLGGSLAARYTLAAHGKSGNGKPGSLEKSQVVPTDRPLQSKGARNFYLGLLVLFVLLYPALDRFLFGYGTNGRIASYGDMGFYVIMALGLNIVVGFAGLLDLGYVAFFAIGAYTWAIIGSTQIFYIFNVVNLPSNLSWVPYLFWPMLLVAALIAAFWGVILGAPTLRLRGDYLAIVTLGFGEIVPIVVKYADHFTNGVNGVVGVQSPGFFGLDWSTVTPVPYYYLILALIAFTIFCNIRLRDSRLGRAWIAIREDEIAAASSGINLVNTKLLAFAAGAFFSGIAGAYHSAKLGSIAPDSFSFGDSIIYLAMVVIGGIGSIPGVIVGAITVYSINLLILNQLDSLATDPASFVYPIDHFIVHYLPGFSFGNIRNLIFGTILVVIMIYRPEGLIPSARRKRELHVSEVEEPGASAMDVVPGAPGFEGEVHVE